MPRVQLPSSLQSLVGGRALLEAEGTTAAEVLARLERSYPRLAGWVLDEQGRLRQHVALFRGGERLAPDAPLAAGDRVDVVPAISGGAVAEPVPEEAPAELLVSTKKGLFVLRGEPGGPMEVVARRFKGLPVEFAMRDPRSGTYIASVTHFQYGPHLFLSDDSTAETDDWRQAEGPVFPEDTGAALERIWVVEPGEAEGELWAGVAPAALFRSTDGGLSWELNRALWDEPTRAEWNPGAGGLCLHSICLWPGEPQRLAVAISAAGVWITEDGGASWRRGGKGLVPRYLPEEARDDAITLCVHSMKRASLAPETLYLQFHGGVYRSDDGGATWNDIAQGLPADFGFPLVVDPRDPARAFVIPLVADVDRVAPGGKLEVWETRDRGATWRSCSQGLPAEDAYTTVLRQAFCGDGGNPLGLYFGATSGEVFGSGDGGASWQSVARRLAPVFAVRVSA